MSSVHKPVRKALAKRKPAVRKVKAGVTFKSRGPGKCVQVDGVNKGGLHAALHRAFGKVDVGAAMEAHARLPVPAPVVHMLSRSTKKPSKYWQGNALQAGARLDAELTSTIKLQQLLQVDARTMHDPEHRARVVQLRWGAARLPKAPATKLRNACARMSMECESMWRFFDVYQLQPLSTQDCVAYGACGTRVDVVVRDVSDPEHPKTCILEIKRGHATNWTNYRPTPAPFQTRPQSTYDHCLLQALASSAMYAHTKKVAHMGPPMLVVCDGAELRAFAPPEWATRELPAIMRAIGAARG